MCHRAGGRNILTRASSQLEKQLEEQESRQSQSLRSVRNVDRTVKDLQLQIDRRDKINTQLTEDISKSRDKIERLLTTIDELQSSDSTNQLQAKRAERDLREEREKALRLERELEGWKALRMERGSFVGAGPREREGSVAGSRRGSGSADVRRMMSNSKGFL